MVFIFIYKASYKPKNDGSNIKKYIQIYSIVHFYVLYNRQNIHYDDSNIITLMSDV